MDNRQIPEYIPEAIAREFQHCTTVITNNRDEHSQANWYRKYARKAQALESLIFHSPEKVWARLAKRAQEDDDFVYTQLISAVFEGLELDGENPWEWLTPKERKEEHFALIKDLRSLAKKLSKYGVNDQLLSLLTEDEELAVRFIAYNLHVTTNEKAESFKQLQWRDREFLSTAGPNISEVFLRLAERLQGEARFMSTHLARPGSKRARFVLFARTLCRHHKEWYGDNLYEVAAEIASIYFPDMDISEDTIRFALK